MKESVSSAKSLRESYRSKKKLSSSQTFNYDQHLEDIMPVKREPRQSSRLRSQSSNKSGGTPAICLDKIKYQYKLREFKTCILMHQSFALMLFLFRFRQNLIIRWGEDLQDDYLPESISFVSIQTLLNQIFRVSIMLLVAEVIKRQKFITQSQLNRASLTMFYVFSLMYSWVVF